MLWWCVVTGHGAYFGICVVIGFVGYKGEGVVIGYGAYKGVGVVTWYGEYKGKNSDLALHQALSDEEMLIDDKKEKLFDIIGEDELRWIEDVMDVD